MTIEEYLERIISFAAKRAAVHFIQEKDSLIDDGGIIFTEDYKAYISILDDATEIKEKLRNEVAV